MMQPAVSTMRTARKPVEPLDMSIRTSALAERLRIYVLTLAGLIMAATPLALWVAWSQTVFILVLAVFVTAGVCFYVLISCERSDGEARHDDESRVHLSNEFLTELSDMGPWVYHNRRVGDASFQRKMDSLKDN